MSTHILHSRPEVGKDRINCCICNGGTGTERRTINHSLKQAPVSSKVNGPLMFVVVAWATSLLTVVSAGLMAEMPARRSATPS